MLLDLLGRFFLVLDSGGIFLLEAALRSARIALILLVNRLQFVTVLHLLNNRVDSRKFLSQIGKLVRVVIIVLISIHKARKLVVVSNAHSFKLCNHLVAVTHTANKIPRIFIILFRCFTLGRLPRLFP